MIAISGDDFGNCVAAGNQDRQEQCDGTPSINAVIAQRKRLNLRGQKQTKAALKKIRSTRFDGISDITTRRQRAKAKQPKFPGDICENAAAASSNGEDRQSQARSSGRSTDKFATDVADKSKAVAADGSFAKTRHKFRITMIEKPG
jgi:hypothetical protein